MHIQEKCLFQCDVSASWSNVKTSTNCTTAHIVNITLTTSYCQPPTQEVGNPKEELGCEQVS